MAKKKSKKASKSLQGYFFSSFKDFFSKNIFLQIKEMVDSTISDIQNVLNNATKKLIKSLFALVIMLVGVVMVIISVPFFLGYVFELPASLFFMIIGSLIFIASIVSLKKMHN